MPGLSEKEMKYTKCQIDGYGNDHAVMSGKIFYIRQ